MTTSDLPAALSVPVGEVSDALVFSNVALLEIRAFIFGYTVKAAVKPAGYYAFMPPYILGAYPTLVVGGRHPDT